MRIEATPPEISDPVLANAVAKEKLRREADATSHDLRLRSVLDTFENIRKGHRDLEADLAGVWAAIDALPE